MTVALVTGGAGLIGSHLVKALLKEGYSVVVADNLSRGTRKNLKGLNIPVEIIDLSRQALCESIFATYKIDEVYHLAAFLGGVEFIRKYPVEAYIKNMYLNMNVLECSRQWEIDKLLFTSTACVYPINKQSRPDSPPLKEEDVEPISPESGYGWAKLMTEFLCQSYIEEYNMKIGIVRMFNVYGPGEAYDEGSHVIPMLCRKAINYPNEKFIVWGDGTQTRSFIYVTDAVEGIIATMKYGINKGPFNIGTEERFTIKHLAETIVNIASEIFDKEIPIEYDTNKPTGVIGRAANCNKARSLLNWYPKVDLETGITETISWIYWDMEEKRKKVKVEGVI